MKNLMLMFGACFLFACNGNTNPPIEQYDLVKKTYTMETDNTGIKSFDLGGMDPRNLPMIQSWCINDGMWQPTMEFENDWLVMDCGSYAKISLVVIE